MIWVAAYVGAVATILVFAHRHETLAHRRDQAARHSQPDRLGREVESVPVHDARIAR